MSVAPETTCVYSVELEVRLRTLIALLPVASNPPPPSVNVAPAPLSTVSAKRNALMVRAAFNVVFAVKLPVSVGTSELNAEAEYPV